MPNPFSRLRSPLHLLRQLAIPSPLKPWLLDPGSLTEKLRQHFGAIDVDVLSECLERPLPVESEQLGLEPNDVAWVRCVCLKVNKVPLIYARTVIPNWQADNPWFQLKQLGNRPLGEVLFQMPGLERTPFELSKHPSAYWPHLESASQHSTTYARRSIFKQQQAPLLLTEAFLFKA